MYRFYHQAIWVWLRIAGYVHGSIWACGPPDIRRRSYCIYPPLDLSSNSWYRVHEQRMGWNGGDASAGVAFGARYRAVECRRRRQGEINVEDESAVERAEGR